MARSSRMSSRGGVVSRPLVETVLGDGVPGSSDEQLATQFLAGAIPGPAGRHDRPGVASDSRPILPAAEPKAAARQGMLIIAPGARQDPERREGGEALVMNGTDQVLYAPARGYAFHMLTCRNMSGSARQMRTCTVAEAIDRGLHPGQCCTGGRLEVV